MRTRLFTIAVACTVAVLFGAANTRADDKAAVADEKALLKLEREWVDAEARHDVVALQLILDDRFVATFGAGKLLDKNAFLKDVTAGAIDPTESQKLSGQTIVLAGDAAVVVETDTIRSMKNGQPSGRRETSCLEADARSSKADALGSARARSAVRRNSRPARVPLGTPCTDATRRRLRPASIARRSE
jgi:hypothetical protein